MEQMITLTNNGLRTRPALAGALLAATCLVPAAYAQQPRDGTVSKSEVSSGSLLLQSSTPGRYVEAPLVAADVKMDIAGPIIRTKLTQRFTNPTQQWVEGVYAFPLPEGAAVDTLKIVIGDRFIEGDIKERQEARIIYEEAAASGQRAGLVEEERPNLFTTSLANIGPGETVAVQIEFQDKARLDNGVWSTRFPLVIGPRYNPKPTFGLTADRTGRSLSVTDPVPDRDRITPPVLHPAHEPTGTEGLRLPVNFDISLEAGVPIADISSQTHGLVVTKSGADGARIHLKDGEVPADRDFVLSWKPEPATAPTASLFREQRNGEDYLLAVVNPPAIKTTAQRRDRETIFVIDNSGSMSGDSMDQAKQGLLLALNRLAPTDEFSTTRWNSSSRPPCPPTNRTSPAPAALSRTSKQTAGRKCCLPCTPRWSTMIAGIPRKSARSCSSRTARSATRTSSSPPSMTALAAPACSRLASARRPTPTSCRTPPVRAGARSPSWTMSPRSPSNPRNFSPRSKTR